MTPNPPTKPMVPPPLSHGRVVEAPERNRARRRAAMVQGRRIGRRIKRAQRRAGLR